MKGFSIGVITLYITEALAVDCEFSIEAEPR